jgi:ribosomal protein S24E
MQVTIIEAKEQPIYKREKVRARIAFQGKVPTRNDVIMALGKKMGKEETAISIRSITASYGTQEAVVEAFCYADKAIMAKSEPKHFQKRTEKTAPKKEEAKAAE